MELFSRALALVLLLMLLPFFSIISIINLCTQGKPIFYQQERVGFKFNNFILYKFRTMIINKGPQITSGNDIRITPWGQFLRMSKLDELPQLINIIRGEMRFIGPRPEVPKYVQTEEFNFLNKVPPGLSDYASILFRNENIVMDNLGGVEPYKELISYKITLAKYYAKRKGFIQDLQLVFLTCLAIVMPKYTNKKLIFPRLAEDLPELTPLFDKISK